MSEMSATRIESAAEMVDVGEKVWIKVIGREVITHMSIHTKMGLSSWYFWFGLF